jgi:uncharacterized protein (DUF2384 family)
MTSPLTESERQLLKEISEESLFLNVETRNLHKKLTTLFSEQQETRSRPCGAPSCCYTDDRALVESLRTQLQQSEKRVAEAVEIMREAIDLFADAKAGEHVIDSLTTQPMQSFIATHVENDDE